MSTKGTGAQGHGCRAATDQYNKDLRAKKWFRYIVRRFPGTTKRMIGVWFLGEEQCTGDLRLLESLVDELLANDDEL